MREAARIIPNFSFNITMAMWIGFPETLLVIDGLIKTKGIITIRHLQDQMLKVSSHIANIWFYTRSAAVILEDVDLSVKM